MDLSRRHTLKPISKGVTGTWFQGFRVYIMAWKDLGFRVKGGLKAFGLPAQPHPQVQPLG